jgi:small nuclear ribonucleoprotein (snRNP)-like protein
MFLKRCFIYAALLLAFATHDLLAEGAQIVVHLKDGRQMAGELHSVSDSSLVVSRRETGAEHISQVSSKEIRQVVVNSKPKVVLQLKNGRQATGKLHGVSDSSVTIFLQGTASSVPIKTEITNQEIIGAMIKGKSNFLKGMGVGLLVGAASGAAIGGIAASQEDDSFFGPEFAAFVLGIYGGAAGIIVGGIIGAATSTSSQEIELVPNQSFLFLKPLARHAERGPEDKW